MSLSRFRFVLLAVFLLSGSFSHAAPIAQPGTPATPDHRAGDEIIVCNQYFHTGTPVVLWSDPGGYQAPAIFHHPVTRPASMPTTESTTEIIRGDDLTLDQLRPHVDQFLIHFDACGLSSECFRVLQRRHLSVHFMCDLDGTIYQTMDLRDDAAHATIANARSIGVETAQIGCIANDESIAPLKQWYRRYDGVTWITIPARFGDGGIRTPHFRGRPLRPFLITAQLQAKPITNMITPGNNTRPFHTSRPRSARSSQKFNLISPPASNFRPTRHHRHHRARPRRSIHPASSARRSGSSRRSHSPRAIA